MIYNKQVYLIILNISIFLLLINFAFAQTTNDTLSPNTTTSVSTVENCPSKLCTYIWGTTLNITHRPGWTLTLGTLTCSASAFQTGTYSTSYWLQTCTYPLNATDNEKDIAHIPIGLIKDLQLENQTKIMNENMKIKTENTYLYAIAVVAIILDVIFGFYIFYTEYWQPAHEE